MSRPCSIRSRASVPSRMSLAAMIVLLSAFIASSRVAVDDTHDVGLLRDHQLLAVEANLGARPLAEKDPVAGLEVERMHLSVFTAGTRADCNDFAFHRLFLGGVGNYDPARRLRLLLNAPHEHAIVQRSEFHKKLRKLTIQCDHLHMESGSGTCPNVKISTTCRRTRSTLGSIHFATSMTNE